MSQVAPMAGFTPVGGVSCAGPGGRNERSCVHSQGTGMVWLLCACGSVSSARLNGRTSMCSPPTCTYRVSHLHIGENIEVLSVICFFQFNKVSSFTVYTALRVNQASHRCVSCGVLWDGSSWCTPCCSRRSRSGEFASSSVCREIPRGGDAACPNGLLLTGCCPWNRKREEVLFFVFFRFYCCFCCCC